MKLTQIVLKKIIKNSKNNKQKNTIQQRFKSKRHNVYHEVVHEIVLSSIDDKRMQSIDSIETYAHGTSTDLVSKKEEIKCSNIIKQYKNV